MHGFCLSLSFFLGLKYLFHVISYQDLVFTLGACKYSLHLYRSVFVVLVGTANNDILS